MRAEGDKVVRGEGVVVGKPLSPSSLASSISSPSVSSPSIALSLAALVHGTVTSSSAARTKTRISVSLEINEYCRRAVELHDYNFASTG